MKKDRISQSEYERLLRYEENMIRYCKSRGAPLPWEREGQKRPSEEAKENMK